MYINIDCEHLSLDIFISYFWCNTNSSVRNLEMDQKVGQGFEIYIGTMTESSNTRYDRICFNDRED